MTMPSRFVCASANPKKVGELLRLMPAGVVLDPRPDELGDVDEDAPTLEGNAILKANAVALFSGQWAIADDTGLEVPALNGEPGVRSARYAGDGASDADNRRLLLARLEGVADRRARFRTVVAVMSPSGEFHFVTGECEGRIAHEERGTNGFGYDAVFVPEEGDGRTFAEMDSDEKDALSHRGRALAKLPALIDRLDGAG